jgi:hypothetical protein
MRKFLLLALSGLLLIAAAGCNVVSGTGDSSPPTISGLIFAVDGDRILVVEGIDSADIPYDVWFDAGNRAVFFTVTKDTVITGGGSKVSADKLQKGQKVQVWADGPLMKSYPEQGGAGKIVVGPEK